MTHKQLILSRESDNTVIDVIKLLLELENGVGMGPELMGHRDCDLNGLWTLISGR